MAIETSLLHHQAELESILLVNIFVGVCLIEVMKNGRQNHDRVIRRSVIAMLGELHLHRDRITFVLTGSC